MLDPGGELPFAEPLAGAVRLRRLGGILLGLALAWAATGDRSVATAETLVDAEALSRTVVVRNFSVLGDRVAGVVGNLSDRPIRDVRLQIGFWWLWADERRQGTNDPSFATIEVLRDEIAPRGDLTFGFRYPSASVARSDGEFVVDVRVVGYRVVESRSVP